MTYGHTFIVAMMAAIVIIPLLVAAAAWKDMEK